MKLVLKWDAPCYSPENGNEDFTGYGRGASFSGGAGDCTGGGYGRSQDFRGGAGSARGDNFKGDGYGFRNQQRSHFFTGFEEV